MPHVPKCDCHCRFGLDPKKAAAEFWNYLQDFADLNQQPPATWTGVAPDHPFLGVATGSIRLNLPPGLNLPDNVL